MPDIIALLNQYIDYFPLVALGCLLLAGLNLPASEDLIIITGALLCHKKPSLLPATLAAIFTGIFATDIFVYWVGTKVRKGTGKSKFFTRLIPEKTMDKWHNYLDKYGILTFIVGRFIPFGFRNTLFFTSGFFNLKFRSFVIYDVIAGLISVNTLFFLAYRFGEVVKRPIKIAGIILFIALISAIISVVVGMLVKKYRRKKNREKIPEAEQ